ncbi:MAG: methylenetetrahydrofolate reductase [Nitrosopumilaceae archaeon]|nr:methylenetetrahydrofolate reductase [Nitrosopumilaceae archaeon]
MTIRYEANPPKILPDVDLEESITKFIDKIKIISKNCDAIHLTENVLGYERISPLELGAKIKKELPNLPITVSLRVINRTENEIQEFVNKAIENKFSGILVLMGDPSKTEKKTPGLVPSSVVKKLREQNYDSKIDLYLSIPNNPNFSKITKKIDAKPKGFITQVIQNTDQVQRLADNLKEFSLIPIVLFPSEKNQKSADFLNLDLTEYRDSFAEFLDKIKSITGDVLITSPSDFTGLKEFLEKN